MQFSQNLIDAIIAVSYIILSDLELADEHDSDHAAIIAETTIDANRLTSFGHQTADEELHRHIEEFGYDDVLTETTRHVTLP